jgi:hypothetical protein
MIRASAEQGLFLERKRPTRRDSGTPKGDVARAHVLIGGDWRRFSRAARLTLSQVLMRARLIIFSTYPDRTRGFLFVHHIPDGPLIANPRFFTLDRSGNGICSLLAWLLALLIRCVNFISPACWSVPVDLDAELFSLPPPFPKMKRIVKTWKSGLKLKTVFASYTQTWVWAGSRVTHEVGCWGGREQRLLWII